MTPHIHWIILVTDNYTLSKAFYSQILKFPIEREVAAEEFCQFSMENSFLAIYGRNYFEKLFPAGTLKQSGGAVYSFPDSSDIDADYAALTSKGVQFISPPKTQQWGQRTAYFTDPDGHIWELQQWLGAM
jgi:catechol 2,3-dioxygenase-like lactoylglutathione lyase family enzyme